MVYTWPPHPTLPSFQHSAPAKFLVYGKKMLQKPPNFPESVSESLIKEAQTFPCPSWMENPIGH